MDAKIKARRQMVAARKRRWRKVVASLVSVVVVVLVGATVAYLGPWLRVTEIQVSGAGPLDARVEASLVGLRGHHGFRLSLATVRKVLAANPNLASEVKLVWMNHPEGGDLKVHAVALPLVGTGVTGLGVAPDGRIVPSDAPTTVTVCTSTLTSLGEPCDSSPRVGTEVQKAMSTVIDALSAAHIRVAVALVEGIGVIAKIPGGPVCELGTGSDAVAKVRVCASLGVAGETVVDDALDAPAVEVG